MRFTTSYAQFAGGDTIENAKMAAKKIAADCANINPVLVIFFAATDYDPRVLAKEMYRAFPNAKTMGCTTAGEARDGELLNGSVVAMAYSAEAFDHCRIALVVGDGEPADSDGVFDNVDNALAFIGEGLGGDLLSLDYRKYVGFILADRISSFSESVLERLGERTDVIFVGGFAGDDYKFINKQMVFYQGKAYRSAAVLALWQPSRGFELLKTQSVGVTNTGFVITRADEERRIIWEFNGRDAAQVYAESINAPVETMNVIDFDENPLALTVDGEPFLRAVVKTVDNRGLQMFASVKEGTRLTLTRSEDVLNGAADALHAKIGEMEGVAAILHVNCASRHTALAKRKQCDAFAALFDGIPSIAFSSYGEIYVGIVAMTSTMILFK